MYPIGYITLMYSIYTTEVFDDWFTKLKDQQAKRRIQVRIDRVEDGNLEILNQSVKVSLNYVSSLDLATGSITVSKGKGSLFF
jgi:hypothetical protein